MASDGDGPLLIAAALLLGVGAALLFLPSPAAAAIAPAGGGTLPPPGGSDQGDDTAGDSSSSSDYQYTDQSSIEDSQYTDNGASSSSSSGFDPTDDVDVVARTIDGEAGGEPRQGQIGVAWVIRNRATDPRHRWPSTLAAVALQPAQFTPWNGAGAARLEALSDSELAPFRAIASQVIAGSVPDPTGGANHFYNPRLASPTWAAGMTRTATIGNHIFLRA